MDSLNLAVAIETQAAKLNKDIDILVQVNTAGEKQKFGITPSEVSALIERIVELKHVHLQGLMTIAPFVEDREIIRRCFRDLRILRDEISGRFSAEHSITMKYLSMGMTEDYDIALEEGANMIRIGRAVFSN